LSAIILGSDEIASKSNDGRAATGEFVLIAARSRFLLRFPLRMHLPGRGSINPRRPRREGALLTVARVEDLPEGRGATVELPGGKELALFNVGGEFHAVENFCPHKGAPLADGDLCGHVIECAWHGWRFDLRTGACLNQPSEPVETYEVVVEEGWIKIRI
jgi:nitrite reductase/ring-hydroxylating ferredoxin subunit